MLAALLVALALPVAAQEHIHVPGMTHAGSSGGGSGPSQSGQAAFSAIAEVVAILSADSATDWSRVNIEALRRHLIDMDDVLMRAQVATDTVPGGARFVVTGEGRVRDAIRRMASAHAAIVSAEAGAGMRIAVENVANGARVTVIASNPRDTAAVARVRGLGFAGLLTEGNHHAPHHLALARGASPHRHD
ncbi:MAG: hypothetical protein ACREOK_01120 [Gemmatimonadaceae bacterium]